MAGPHKLDPPDPIVAEESEPVTDEGKGAPAVIPAAETESGATVPEIPLAVPPAVEPSDEPDPTSDAPVEGNTSDAGTHTDALSVSTEDDGRGDEHRFRVTHLWRKPNGGGNFVQSDHEHELSLSDAVRWMFNRMVDAGKHQP